MLRHDHRGRQIEARKSESLPISPSVPTTQQLRQLLQARQARANFFGAHLFADPAWDILLLAYVALLERQHLLVSEVCRAGAVPATITLRWIKTLEQDGWLVHRDDPLDGPRSRLELATAGKVGMERYLTLVWPSMPL